MAKLALLAALLCSTQAADSNLFKLDSDSIIIRTPQNLDELKDSPATNVLPAPSNDSIFSIDESKPIKDHVFFMENDFFKPVDHAHEKQVLSLDEIIDSVKDSENATASDEPVSFEQEKAEIYARIKEQENQ